ncbi:MAG: DUF4433 domain-containing protein [Planctomycetota bacterium]
MQHPVPTLILRLVHVANLEVLLRRGAVHASNHVPRDGLGYRAIHDPDVQGKRQMRRVPCGPGGTIRDYVSFYFGPRSPMLLRLQNAEVPGYAQGQEPPVYLVSDAFTVARAGGKFVFTDGHSLSANTRWFDHLGRLDEVDWEAVNSRYWASTPQDPDRQRRKQAEFLVHRALPWELVARIVVLSEQTAKKVESILADHPGAHQPDVGVRREWYYP